MTVKKKILLFTPGGVGGAERMSVLIGKCLPKDRFDVKFVVIGRLKNIYNIIPDGFEIDCIPVRNIYCFSTLRIWWKIIREKPDIVFASQVSYNSRVIVATRMCGKKVVIRSSGMLGSYSFRKLFEVKLFYPFAHLLIAQQDDMREEMISILKVNPSKVLTIHNPIDTKEIDNLASNESPFLSINTVNFVQTASVCYRKAQDVSIKAFSIVKNKINDAHLFLVGDFNNDSDYYKHLLVLITNLQLKDSVHFEGYQKNPFNWVKNADCFLLPSRAEGLPNALIEASYLGVPCVATRCLNIVDDIIFNGKNGYVVDVDDVQGFANSMVNAINLKECQMIYKPGTSKEFSNMFDSL